MKLISVEITVEWPRENSKAQKAREDISFQAMLLRSGGKDTAGRRGFNYPENHTALSLFLSLYPATNM